MPIIPFVTTTFLGATLWCSVLVGLGYFYGDRVKVLMVEYSHQIGYIAIPVIAILIWYKIFKK